MRAQETDGSCDLVSSSGNHTQHPCSVFAIPGFAQNLVIYDHDSVSPENVVARALLCNHDRFFTGHALGKSLGSLAKLRNFWNVSWLNLEGNSGIAQQFVAARGG